MCVCVCVCVCVRACACMCVLIITLLSAGETCEKGTTNQVCAQMLCIVGVKCDL